MHIYLDTNIFERDPFWKNSYYVSFLQVAKEKGFSIYMSKIVLDELKFHTIRNYKKAYKEYEKTVTELERFIDADIAGEPPYRIEEIFDKFYNDLQEEYTFEILNFKNDFLEEIIKRAVSREKPFSESKTEVKDCTIWLTYADHVESGKLEECFIITNNLKDFYKKDPISNDPLEYEIHDELKKDTSRFRGFHSIKDFFKKIIEPKLEANKKFKGWLAKAEVNAKYVFELVQSEESRFVESAINKYVDNWDLNRNFGGSDYPLTGYCQVHDTEWLESSEPVIDVLEDSCIISATISLLVTIGGYAYNPMHDSFEDKYNELEEKYYQADVAVNFILHSENRYDAFDIEDIQFEPYPD